MMYSILRLQVLRLNSGSRMEICRGLSVGMKKEAENNYDNQTAKAKLSEENLRKDMPIPDMQNPFEREKAQCILCKYKIRPDYKNVKLLSQFVSPYTGRIYGRHISGLCSAQQQRVENEILKAQNAGFMAYYLKEVEFLKDPKLFDPQHPIRRHRF